MAEGRLLERILGRIEVKDRGVRDGLVRLRKEVEGMEDGEAVREAWRLLFHGRTDVVGVAELSVLEKMLSYGLIDSSLTLNSPDGDSLEDRSGSAVVIAEPVYILDETVRMAARLCSQPSHELECIKIFLTASTTSLRWDSLAVCLDSLLRMVSTGGSAGTSAVNRSAARGALTQIVHDRLSRERGEMMGWIGGRRPKSSHICATLLEILLSSPTEWDAELVAGLDGLFLHAATFTDHPVFCLLLRCLDRMLGIRTGGGCVKASLEMLVYRLLLPHLNDVTGVQPWPLQVESNRESFLGFVESKLVGDAQLSMDMFLNFDCDPALDPIISPLLESTCSRLLVRWSRSLLEWAWLVGRDSEDDPAWERNLAGKGARREAVGLFNRKPRLGLDFAASHGLVTDVQSTARFLRNTRGISKTVLGDYLSTPDQTDLLDAFMAQLSFHGSPFIPALRSLLQQFRLPGEAQKIDRIVESFASLYTHQNPAWMPSVAKRSDLAYQLAFMAVMLNTDLHSPQIRQKMGMEAFLVNCRELEGGREILVDLLEDMYEDIAGEEIQLADYYIVVPPDRKVEQEGWGTASSEILLLRLLDHSLTQILSTTQPDDDHEEYLDVLGDAIELLMVHGLEPKAIPLLQAATRDGGPRTMHWLHDFIQRNGNSLKVLWPPIISFLASTDMAACVDANHNIRVVEVGKLDGPALLPLLHALTTLDQSERAEAFIRYYAGQLETLSPHSIERLVTHSYPSSTSTTTTSSPEDDMGVFLILSRAFKLPLMRTCSFRLTTRLAHEQMPLLASPSTPHPALSHLSQALIQFGLDPDPSIADEAMSLFRFLADLLYTEHVKTAGPGIPVAREEYLLRWNLVMAGLTHIAIHQDNVVLCGNAIRLAYEIIRQQGSVYPPDIWLRTFRTCLAPTLEDLGMQRGRLASDLTIAALNWIMDIVGEYAPVLLSDQVSALPYVLDWIEGLAGRPSEQIARSALVAFNMLVSRNQHLFSPSHWNLIIRTLRHLIQHTMPLDLADYPVDTQAESAPAPPKSKLQSPRTGLSTLLPAFSATSVTPNGDLNTCRYKCALHLLILHSSKDMLLNGILTNDHDNLTFGLDHLISVLEAAEESAAFANQFNANLPLRTALWRAGFLDALENILLAKQETTALVLSISLLSKAYHIQRYRQDADTFSTQIDQRMQRIALSALSHYLDLLSDQHDALVIRRSLKAWPPVIALLLSTIQSLLLSDIQLTWLAEIYEPALEIYRLDRSEAASAAHTLLLFIRDRYINTHVGQSLKL